MKLDDLKSKYHSLVDGTKFVKDNWKELLLSSLGIGAGTSALGSNSNDLDAILSDKQLPAQETSFNNPDSTICVPYDGIKSSNSYDMFVGDTLNILSKILTEGHSYKIISKNNDGSIRNIGEGRFVADKEGNYKGVFQAYNNDGTKNSAVVFSINSKNKSTKIIRDVKTIRDTIDPIVNVVFENIDSSSVVVDGNKVDVYARGKDCDLIPADSAKSDSANSEGKASHGLGIRVAGTQNLSSDMIEGVVGIQYTGRNGHGFFIDVGGMKQTYGKNTLPQMQSAGGDAYFKFWQIADLAQSLIDLSAGYTGNVTRNGVLQIDAGIGVELFKSSLEGKGYNQVWDPNTEEFQNGMPSKEKTVDINDQSSKNNIYGKVVPKVRLFNGNKGAGYLQLPLKYAGGKDVSVGAGFVYQFNRNGGGRK